MKTIKVFSLLTLLLCVSCSQERYIDEINDQKNEYLVNWIKRFGLIDTEHNWNMAKLVKADVNPAAFGNDVTVKIYETTNGKTRLIGHTDEETTLYLDVLRGTDEVTVSVVNKYGHEMTNGIYQIYDGMVAIDKPSAKKAPVLSRDGESTSPRFDWTIACEDLGNSYDFDFNDVVFGINHVAGDRKITVTALAAGGVLEAKIFVNDKLVGEIHDMVRKSSPKSVMLNTTNWSGLGRSIDVAVDKDWNMATDMGDIRIEIDGADEAKVISTPEETGSFPQIICIAGDWQWPSERTRLETAYPNFSRYNKNMSDITWLESSNIDNIIPWIVREGSNPSVSDHIVPVADYSIDMINANGKDWTSAWSSGTKIWDYVPGLVSKAIMTYCEVYDEFETTQDKPYQMAKAYVDKGFNGDTQIDGSFVTGSLDNIATGKTLISMYRHTNQDKYKNAAKAMYDYLRGSYTRISYNVKSGVLPINPPSINYGGFVHKISDYPNQMWLDGLYMGAAFMAEYVATFSPSDAAQAWDDISAQFYMIHSQTYDADKQLNYHAWSATPTDVNSKCWADATTGCSSEFWGRGMGWYFAALADVLEYMPRDNQNFQAIEAIFKQVAAGIKRWQDPTSGVWYQLMQHGSSVHGNIWGGVEFSKDKFKFNLTDSDNNPYTYSVSGGQSNYLEASASCMFTYALLKGLRLGLLDESTYRTAANNAYAGLITTFIRKGASVSYTGYLVNATKEFTLDKGTNLINICKSAGLGPSSKPYRDGSISYYLNGLDASEVVANEGKGIGPFIFASLEYELAKTTSR